MTGNGIARIVVAAIVCSVPLPSAAADLQPRTTQAYRAYVDAARDAFVARLRTGVEVPALADGVISAGAAGTDAIIDVPGGLVHHWRATAFVRGATLDAVVEISSDYAALRSVYKAVVDSTLLERDGDTYRVRMRLKEGGGGVTGVLDVESTIRYVHPTPRSVYLLSDADQIREVVDAGRHSERLLPPGHDSGYLWHASTFTYALEQTDGVYVEMETIGLSRRFPPLLGWLIEPIARHLGRRSVATSLEEFAAALRLRASTATAVR